MPRKPKFDFNKAMDKLMKQAGSKPFRPGAWYNEDGDIVEAFWADCSYYAEWLNPQITLLRKHSTKEIVGVQIWALDDGGKNARISKVVPHSLEKSLIQVLENAPDPDEFYKAGEKAWMEGMKDWRETARKALLEAKARKKK